MAKHSILLTGKNRVMIGEFFTHHKDKYECLSCSGRFEDIRNHLKYYRPDALVYCLLEDNFDEMQQIVSAKSKLEDAGVSLVIIGQAEDCDEFNRYSGNQADLAIEKASLSLAQIATRLSKFLSSKSSAPAAGQAAAAAQPNSQPAAGQSADDQTLFDAMRALEMDLGLSIPASLAPPSAAPSFSFSTGRKHILVVDDSPLMLKAIKESLRDRYDVATAVNGKIARKYLENKTVDLILLDYEMPEESGAEVLKKLRQEDSTKNIPVIFLTGVKEKEKIQKVLQLKPQGYLLKPIEHDKLLQIIKELFGEV